MIFTGKAYNSIEFRGIANMFSNYELIRKLKKTNPFFNSPVYKKIPDLKSSFETGSGVSNSNRKKKFLYFGLPVCSTIHPLLSVEKN